MFKKLLALVLLSSMLLTGCSGGKNFSLLPEEIVAHAIEANEKVDTYDKDNYV